MTHFECLMVKVQEPLQVTLLSAFEIKYGAKLEGKIDNVGLD